MCPICKAEVSPRWSPFCSRRCADVDLARWMNGAYVVEGEDGEAEDALAANSPSEPPSH